MFAATGFIVKHRKKIIAILVVLALLLILWLDNDDPCLSDSGSGGGSGPTTSEGLAYPVDEDAPVSSPFGPRNGLPHNGTDLAPPHGAPIYAFADGTVIAAQDSGVSGFGGWIVLLHDIDGEEVSTVYGHMEPGGVLVSDGDTVEAGEHIARVGNAGASSGPHLHFEVHEGNRLSGGSPVDPAPWLDRALSGADSDTGAGEDQDDDADTGPAPGTVEDDDSGDLDAAGIRDLRASQIIDVGQQRDESEMVVVSAIAAALVEADLHNLASDAVPESKNFPNDGSAPGDYDSVGLFQQRASVWGDQAGGIAGLMDPAQQIGWYYDTAAEVPHESVGQIAADVERPAAEYRGKYAERAAEAVEYYERLSGNAAGSLAAGDPCATDGGGLGDVPADSDLGRRILAAARTGFGLPYVWGGGNTDGPTGGGYDCSGLTQFAVYEATDGQIE
ncbi:MAG: peptidoglycan DD-metalloendopeptidase family protein, partial [Nocardioidaceae bacterium]|nr:peptidoglycan DD-metalloendopeptidase family protein [Nocardioidaceae bacterium]